MKGILKRYKSKSPQKNVIIDLNKNKEYRYNKSLSKINFENKLFSEMINMLDDIQKKLK